MGFDGLLDEDQYLAEVNLDNLEQSSGLQQEYWLVAIRAAREACILQNGSQLQRRHIRTSREGQNTT
jgi:hypothetical protein